MPAYSCGRGIFSSFTHSPTSGRFRISSSTSLGASAGSSSLQSLPRRITLDFRDVFSEGFLFDTITGTFRIERGLATTFVRVYKMSVRQVIKQFALKDGTREIDWSKVSLWVKTEWDHSRYETKLDVVHIVTPNEQANRDMLPAKYLPWASCYYELGTDETAGRKFLRESGFNEFYDPLSGRPVGAPGAYDYGPERCSWLTHHLTNWIGDDGFLRQHSTKIRNHNPLGWVRNEPDGTVAGHFEGEPEAVDALRAVRKSERTGDTITISFPDGRRGWAAGTSPRAPRTTTGFPRLIAPRVSSSTRWRAPARCRPRCTARPRAG